MQLKRRSSSLVLLTFLIASACGDASLEAADLQWWEQAQKVPETFPAPAKPLRPILKMQDGQAVTNADQWPARRAEIRADWQSFIGPRPQAKQRPISSKTLSAETVGSVQREMIEYEAEPGRMVKAFLLRPIAKATEKRPALVVFHGTTAHTMHSVAGTGDLEHKHYGLRLAEEGFVVICPSNYLWEQKGYGVAAQAAKTRHPNSLGIATMIADGERAVDLLLQQPDVDPARIGAIGNSLGAKETLYLMAFDDRVKVGVFSEGGIGMTSTNWEAPWYLGDVVKSPEFVRDHHELLALIAPRPFLIFGGEEGRGCADGERSWPYIKEAQEVSKLLNAPPQQGMLNHHQGHSFSLESQRKAFDWLKHYLALNEPKSETP